RPSVVSMTAMWRGYRGGITAGPGGGGKRVRRPLLEAVAQSMNELPPGFPPHPQIGRFRQRRARMGEGGRPIHAGTGERRAYGSLLYQGVNVRMTGQDCSRGTFSHRHAVVTDITNGREHLVLGQLHPDQGLARIYDSPLSEAGVMGFEFGYSLDYPDALVMW